MRGEPESNNLIRGVKTMIIYNNIKYAETEERLRMEREIVDKLNKEKEEEIKKESKPIGFVIGQTKKKRKYTRKKNVERKSTDTPSDSEPNTGDE